MLLIQAASQAQNYNIRNFLLEDGLPQSQVFDIIQDSKGYLWVATVGGGVARFDGKKFTVYNTENGLSDNQVTDILEDKQGAIWFATHSGISRFDGKSFITYGEKQGLPGGTVLCMAQDRKGVIWAGTERGGLFRLEKEGYFKKIPVAELENAVRIDAVRAIFPDKSGKVWVGTDAGAFVFGDQGYSHYDASTGICGTGIWSIGQDHFGNIWFGTFGMSMCRYDGKSFKKFGPDEGINSKVVLSIFEDDEHHIWAGTDGAGVFKIRNNHADSSGVLLSLNENNGLSSNRVRCIFQDKEGNIWIGTDGGLSRFDRGMFTTYNTKDGLSSNFVLSFLEDEKGGILMGTQTGINYFDGQSVSAFKPGGKDMNSLIWSMLLDSRKRLWVGTYLQGLYMADGKKVTQYSSKGMGLSNDVIFDIAEDTEGNIWIGTDYGIAVVYHDTLYDLNDTKSITRSRIRAICIDSKKNIWFGTRSGLIRYTPSGSRPAISDFEYVHLNEKIDKSVIFSVLEDDQGFIWLGTYGAGVVRLNPTNNSFINLTQADGLSSNAVLSMVLDGKYLWIGTISGINRFDLELYNTQFKKQFRHFGKADGFSGIEVNQNAVMKDSKGNIWFGTGSGAVKYDHRYDRENKIEPQTMVSGIRLFFQSPDWLQFCDSLDGFTWLPLRLELPYNQNHLTFDYIGINLTAPEKVRYQFMLEGLDKDWSPVTTEIYASYPSIPPGEYTFLVKACNNEGVWNSQPARFSFVIHPPFWKTTWFYSACAVIMLAGTLSFSMLRTRTLRKAKKRLEQEVQNRTRELHEKNLTLEEKNQIIEAKNKDITDSIHYARQIQQAILQSEEYMLNILPRHFAYLRPKDVVSGDFYWAYEATERATANKKVIWAAVDCTGHGVPGAFMSMIGNSLLNEIIIENRITEPDRILNLLREKIIKALEQKGNSGTQRDGMDVALCVWDKVSNTLSYSGANNPIYVISQGKLREYKPDKMPVGFYPGEPLPFSVQIIPLSQGDCIYSFTDGYADQFGGPKGKKFMYSRLEKLLLSIHTLSMPEQKVRLENALLEWKGGLEQVDDILVMGVRI
ncbi:MAG: two-component regulator propeller domain-containing protein [Bacteroidota bacterium]